MKIFLEDFSTIDIFLQNMPFLFNLNFLPENVPFKKKNKKTKPWANANYYYAAAITVVDALKT